MSTASAQHVQAKYQHSARRKSSIYARVVSPTCLENLSKEERWLYFSHRTKLKKCYMIQGVARISKLRHISEPKDNTVKLQWSMLKIIARCALHCHRNNEEIYNLMQSIHEYLGIPEKWIDYCPSPASTAQWIYIAEEQWHIKWAGQDGRETQDSSMTSIILNSHSKKLQILPFPHLFTLMHFSSLNPAFPEIPYNSSQPLPSQLWIGPTN